MVISGEEYLTMFDGVTGEALNTIDYPMDRGSVSSWGDSYGGRSERYLAGVAYLNGSTPSLIECRGYYAKASMAALDWSREGGFELLWSRIDTYEKDSEGNWGTYVTDETGSKTRVARETSIYGQGNHNLSVCDADNDGKDEIVFGSAVVDDNGEGLCSTQHGHGDALHVTDFNNDGEQEVFQVHEDKNVAEEYGAEYRKAGTGNVLSAFGARADVGRGVMANIDDEFAAKDPNALSMFWCSASADLFDLTGGTVKNAISADGQTSEVNAPAPGDTNFLIYWDGDLSRELLDRTRIDKYTVSGGTERLETFSDVHDNNGSKATPALCADLFGDWREEVAFGTADDTALRIFTTTEPTDYKLTTLLHDTQYREAVAWQNVGYNQPAHPSYYIGSASLKAGENYLEPKAGFDTVYYAAAPQIETERESRESMVYTANSFNDGDSARFTNVTVVSQEAPYNNVARVTGDAVLDLRYLFDESVTPPPATTPEPPKPTAAPTYSHDFEDAQEGVILALGNPSEPDPYEGFEGMRFYIGGRNGGDSTTHISVVSDGNPGKAVAMRSGRFATGGTRAPRVELITPSAEPGSEIIAIMDVKVELGNTLYYSDSTSTQATEALISGDDAWHTLTISVEKNASGSAARTFYVDDEEVASDSVNKLPVLWSAGVEANSSVVLDNYSVRVEAPEAVETDTPVTDEPEETETPVDPDDCVRIEAEYNADGSLASVIVTENEAAEEETPAAYTKVFYWSDLERMIPIAMYSGSFDAEAELMAADVEAVDIEEDAEEAVSAAAETTDEPSAAETYTAQESEDVNTDTISAVDAAYYESEDVELYEAAATEDGTYKISFDWKPGETVSFHDQNGANIVTLTKNEEEPLTYRVGSGDDTVLHTGLISDNSWYHIELVADLEARTVDISAMDYTNNSETRSVYAVGLAGTDGYIASMNVSRGAYLDNVRMSGIEYLVPMTLYSFNVSDTDAAPIAEASVRIGSNSITTDSSGHAAIKLKNDDYTYTATKERYKSGSGEFAANAEEAEKTTNITLDDGEERDIYVNYTFGDVNLLDNGTDETTSEKVGTAYENTVYDVTDETKLREITYTFPSDEEEITPGYEDYMGKTYTFVYDADASTSNGIVIGEGADTYIDLGYKIKRTPTEADTEVLDINFSADGYESVKGEAAENTWSSSIAPEYVTDEAYGIKYAQLNGLNSNKLTVNMPEYEDDNLVIEFDITFKELTWGGVYYGITPYFGNTAGQAFGMRTSGESNTQWQWCYRKGKDNYLPYAVGSDKGYTYSYNWKDRWAHVVMAAVPDENRFSVSIVNRDSGVVYVQDASLPFGDGVNGTNHITKLEFGVVQGSGSPRDVIGIADLKAYTVGVPNTVAEETVDIYPGLTIDISQSEHITDYEGLDFDLAGMFDVSYEFESEPGTTVTTGYITSDGGKISVSTDIPEENRPNYIVVKYDGSPVKRYRINWLTRTFTKGAEFTFDDGGTGPFNITNTGGYYLSNVNGELAYTRDAGVPYNNGVYINGDIVSGKVANEFVFSFDYRVEAAQYKGYMFLRDAAGTELVRMETHVYIPRIKIFKEPSSNETNFRGDNFKIGNTYTFVFSSSNYASSGRTLTLDIYNQGDYDRATNTSKAEPVLGGIVITPASGTSDNGFRFSYQAAQNAGTNPPADTGDQQYFDNFTYYYYKYE